MDLFLQWLIGDLSTTSLIYSIVIGIVILVLISQFTNLLSIKHEVTSLLVGLPVQSKYGLWIGEIVSVDEKKQIIKYKDKTNHSIKVISRKNFILGDGRIVI